MVAILFWRAGDGGTATIGGFVSQCNKQLHRNRQLLNGACELIKAGQRLCLLQVAEGRLAKLLADVALKDKSII